MKRRRRGRARLARRLSALAVACFVCATHAQEPSLVAALGADAPDIIVAQVVVNQERKGDYFLTVIGGRFLARTRDLRAMGLRDVRGRTWINAGEEYVWLDSIAGMRTAFDDKRLSLALTADPALLPSTTVDFWAGHDQKVAYPDNASAFLNYDIGYAGGNRGFADGWFATTQMGARTGDFLFLSDSTCAADSTDRRCVRLTTSLVHDNRDTLVRSIAGDFAIAPNLLGPTLAMGGLSYSKLYDMDPYFIRYPQQSLRGQLPTASEVDVYIDGQKVRTLRLPAGSYDLTNVTQATGYRSVDVVIRDSFGREQRINTSFYSTERSLKAGLHEYSYNVGALRENFGTQSNDYGPLAFAGFHRYGWSDSLTVGVRAEGKSGLVSGGPSATIVVGSAGVVNLAASVSEHEGKTGGAAIATYNYLGQHWNAALLARKDTPHYANLVDSDLVRRNWEAAGNIGYTSPAFGAFNVGAYAYDAYQGSDRRAASASYGRPLFDGRASFFVTVVGERSPDKRVDVFAGFTYNFDADYQLTGYYQRLKRGSSETLQFQKNQPVGEGLGYVVGVSHLSDDSGSSTQFTPSFQYNGRWAQLRGYAQQSNADGSPRSYSLSVAGGIAWVPGMIAAGRPVLDSFGVVKVDELEGVRVFVNSEEIGRTGRDGRVFVPSLSSFVDNQVSIDAATLPLDFTFPETMRVVSPAYRAGAAVNFHAKELRAFAGILKIRVGETLRPAEYFDAVLDVGGRPVTFVTGRGGEYYVEDQPHGRYTGTLKSNGTRCRFELDVRKAQGPLTDLGETVCRP